MKHILNHIILFGLCYICAVSSSLRASTDTNYLGISGEAGFNTNPTFTDRSIRETQILGLGSTRMGLDAVGGATAGSSFTWAARDTVVNKYMAAGIRLHAVISYRNHVSRGSSFRSWTNNWNYFVRGVMNRYKGKLDYYILDNEPDLFNVTPEQSVIFTRIAFEVARSIDPEIKIQSPPPSRPDSTYLKEMLQLGVADYCDYIGVHAYGSQINDGRLNMPWVWMQELGIRKPVRISESAVCPCWAPQGVDSQEWRRRWLAQYYVAAKRYGIDHVMLFALTFDDVNFAFIDRRVSNNWKYIEPGYSEIKNWFRNDPFSNGDFELSSDGEHGWHIYFNPDTPERPDYIRFVENDPVGARTGKGYVRMDTARTTQPIILRQIAEQLRPGVPHTVKAWVWVTGGGTPRLKALGWDHMDGDAEKTASTSIRGSWQILSTTFTPTKTWAVIELSTTGTGGVGHSIKWDDVSLEENAVAEIHVESAAAVDGPYTTSSSQLVNGSTRTISVPRTIGTSFYRLRLTGSPSPAPSLKIVNSRLEGEQMAIEYVIGE